MYRVMLVDDECIILNGLKSIIDWQACGYIIAGTFARASDALHAAPALRPDLVITDIEMPGTNGLQLIAKLRALLPDARFAILTAHDHFPYAQEAIRQGAFGYLLKPIEKDELIELLSSLSCELDERARRRGDIASHILARVLSDGPASCSSGELAAAGTLISEGCRLIYASPGRLLRGGAYELRTPEQEFARGVRELLQPRTYLYRNGVWAFVVSGDAAARKVCERFPGACCGSGRPLHSPKTAHAQYTDELADFIDARFVQGGIVHLRRKCVIDDPPLPDDALVRRLTEALDEGDMEHADECLAEARAQLEAYPGLARQDALSYARALYSSTPAGQTTLEDMENLIDMLAYMRWRMTERLRLGVGRQLAGAQLVAHVKLYLDAHFMIPDLRMSDVAGKFYINYSYLSTIFKKEAGVNFNQYLLGLRVGEAKRLLSSTGMPAADIAQRAGFGDVKHFFHAFKRYTGQSPGRFRRQQRRAEPE